MTIPRYDFLHMVHLSRHLHLQSTAQDVHSCPPYILVFTFFERPLKELFCV